MNKTSVPPLCSASTIWPSPATALSDKDAAFLESGIDKNKNRI